MKLIHFTIYFLIMVAVYFGGAYFGHNVYQTDLKHQIQTSQLIEIDKRFYAVFEVKRRDFEYAQTIKELDMMVINND